MYVKAIQAQFRMENGTILYEWTDEDADRHTIALNVNILMILLQQAAAIVWSHFKLVPRE